MPNGQGLIGFSLSGEGALEKAWEHDKSMLIVPSVAVLAIHLYLKTAEAALAATNDPNSLETAKSQLVRAREAIDLAIREGRLAEEPQP